jgi:hypothetical protein
MKQEFGLLRVRLTDSPSTKYSDQFVGPHKHIWLSDWERVRDLSGLEHGDSFASREIPLAAYRVRVVLPMLEGTDYLESVVRALCDVDNYYAYLARDVLSWESVDVLDPEHPPTRQQLDEWWERNKQFFTIEHDAERALPLLKLIANSEGMWLPGAARQTLRYHGRSGVPTRGAEVGDGVQLNGD